MALCPSNTKFWRATTMTTPSTESSSLPSNDGVDNESSMADGNVTSSSCSDSDNGSNNNAINAVPSAKQDATDCSDPIAYYQNKNPAIMSYYPSVDGGKRRRLISPNERDPDQPNRVSSSTMESGASGATHRTAATPRLLRTKQSTRSLPATTRHGSKTSGNEKPTRWFQQTEPPTTIGDDKVSPALYLWKKIGKKRKRYPAVPGQFEDALEPPSVLAAGGTRDASATSRLVQRGRHHHGLPHALQQQTTTTEAHNAAQQHFAVECLQNWHHKYRQLVERYRQQTERVVATGNHQSQPQSQSWNHNPRHVPVPQHHPYQGMAAQSQPQTIVAKLQMELQAKIMKAHIVYNQALLADATTETDSNAATTRR